MNFFERQAAVRRQSRLLVFYFVIAVIGIVAAMNLVAQLAITQTSGDPGPPEGLRMRAAVLVTLATLVLIGGAGFFKTRSLKKGGGAQVAIRLGGIQVPPDTTDPHLRRLSNVVEELCIAATMPVPDVFVLQHEPAINAFAAGHNPADAAIAVTSGTLERLNRAELEGVIGHELSHISNGDTRLNMRLMGTVYGIEALAITGRVLLLATSMGRGSRRGRSRHLASSGRGSRSSNSGGGAVALMMLAGLAMMVVGYIGVFMGRIIKAAVSRQREYLADASAVQFTRQTEGLAGALKKIGGLDEGSHLEDGKVDEVSHMLFGNGLKLSSFYATHPPIVRRIQALDPAFSAEALQAMARNWRNEPPVGLAEDRAMGLVEPGVAPAPSADVDLIPDPAPVSGNAPGTPLPAADQTVAVDPVQVVATTGALDDSGRRWARNLLATAPRDVLRRAHDEEAVLPLVLGLVMAAEPATNTRQHHVVADRLGPAVADAAWAEAQAFEQLHPSYRLPLAEIAFPALRRHPDKQLNTLIALLHALIWVDGQVTPHEYFLARLVARTLEDALGHTEAPGSPSRSVHQYPDEVALLLSLMARLGHNDPEAADQAYAAGFRQLGVAQIPPRPAEAEQVTAVDAVWPALDNLWWPERSQLIGALVGAAAHDGVMTVAEVELLRLVCAMLRCPLPPQAVPA